MTDAACVAAAHIRHSSSLLSHSEGSPSGSDNATAATHAFAASTLLTEQSRAQHLANECLQLKEELATLTQRYEAQLQQTKRESADAVEVTERKAKRDIFNAKLEAREKEKRIVDLTRQLVAARDINNTDLPNNSFHTDIVNGSFASTSLRSLLASRDADIELLTAKIGVLQSANDRLHESLTSAESRLATQAENEDYKALARVSTLNAESTPQQIAENREMSKRVVSLATELARSRAERDLAVKAAAENDALLKVAKINLEQLTRDSERYKRELAACQVKLITETEREDELQAAKQDLSRLRATHSECDKREQQFVLFRQQHENCAVTMIDQKARLAALDNQVQRLEVLLSDAQRQEKAANDTVLQLKKERAVALDEVERWRKQYTALTSRLTSEELDRRAETESLRRKIDDENRLRLATKAELDRAHGALSAEQAAFRRLEETLTSTRLALEKTQSNCTELAVHQKRATELEGALVKIQQEHSLQLQELRKHETERAASLKDHNERLQLLQRKNLELIETRQHLESRTKDYHKLRDDYHNLVVRINELEGSYLDGTSTSRRLTGLLESMTVELSQQVADHLRLEFMRGGTKTAALFRKVFNLDSETAKEIVDVLSHLYLMLRAKIPVDRMCQLLNVKEITVRRIITGFSVVNEKYAPTLRRVQLSNENASKRVIFRGAERIHLLCSARRSTSTINRFANETMILAKCCSFLTPALVCFPAFAYHTIAASEQGESKEGQSVLLKLDSESRTFEMIETRVTNAFTAVKSIGQFNESIDSEALGTCKLVLNVVDRFSARSESDAAIWESTQHEPTNLVITLRWEKRHNGAAVDLPGGGRLSEITVAELSAIEEIFSHTRSLLNHRAWDLTITN